MQGIGEGDDPVYLGHAVEQTADEQTAAKAQEGTDAIKRQPIGPGLLTRLGELVGVPVG